MTRTICYAFRMVAFRYVALLVLCHVCTGPLLGCGYPSFRGTIPISRHTSNLRAVGAFSPDGTRIAVAESALSPTRVETTHFNVYARGPIPDTPAQWRLVASVRLTDLFAVDVAFSPDGRYVAIAGMGRGHNVVLWDAERRRIVRTLPGSAPLTQAVAFGPDSTWLLTAGIDGRLRAWDIASGAVRAEVRDSPGLLRQSRFPLVIAKDGSFVVYPRTDGSIAFADPSTGTLLQSRATGGREIYDLALSADGRWLAVATDAGSALWDLKQPGRDSLPLGTDRVPALAFFPDGQTLLLSAEHPRQSRVVEIPTGRTVYAFANGSAFARNTPLSDSDAAQSTGAVRSPGTRPEGTRPEGTRPEGTRPEGTRPEGTRPEGTRPEGTRENHLWGRLRRSFPRSFAEPALRSLVLSYLRFPSVHRVSISPENLWVAFFDGGQAGLVITQRHYLMRARHAPEPPSRRATPPPPPALPRTPPQMQRLQESI